MKGSFTFQGNQTVYIYNTNLLNASESRTHVVDKIVGHELELELETRLNLRLESGAALGKNVRKFFSKFVLFSKIRKN